jgi:hypothetical protein
MPYIDHRGYVIVIVDGRRVREHRLVMERAIGRLLTDSEVVHHKDGNKANNALENLELLPNQSAHLLLAHSTMNRRKKNPPPPRFCHCGKPHKARGLCDRHYAEWQRRRIGRQLQMTRLVCWCGMPHVARGLCDKHYSQAKKLGFPAHLGSIVFHRKTNASTRSPLNRSSSNRAVEPEP